MISRFKPFDQYFASNGAVLSENIRRGPRDPDQARTLNIWKFEKSLETYWNLIEPYVAIDTDMGSD